MARSPGVTAAALLLPFLASGSSSLAAGGVAPDPGQRYAIVIGISDYGSPSIPGLRFADADARAFHDFLRSPAAGLGGIPADNIRLLLNGDATARNVRAALTTFLRAVTPRDVIIVFIVAHGLPDPWKLSDHYLIVHDSEVGSLPATAISMAELHRAIIAPGAHATVVFADLAHSSLLGSPREELHGNPVNAEYQRLSTDAPDGFVVFTASHLRQLSQEGEQWGGGHGVFTYFLLRGLEGDADEDGDRVVTLGELMEYTRDQVRRATRDAQVPFISPTPYNRAWPVAAVR